MPSISVPGAILAGSALSAGVGAAGSLIGGSKAGAGAGQANQLLQQQMANLAPYNKAGQGTLQAQQDLLGLNGPDAAAAAMQNYQTSPGYQWQLGQGLRAVDAGASARGLLRSGAALKAEQEFGQGLANTDFTNYYNRLMGISQLGENAAANTGTTAGTAANLAQGAGNTQGSIYGNIGGGIGNTINSLLSNKDFMNWIGPGGGNTPAGSLAGYGAAGQGYGFAPGFSFGGMAPSY